jgi:hypothetical protein
LTPRGKRNKLLAWEENVTVDGKFFGFLKKPGIAFEETIP